MLSPSWHINLRLQRLAIPLFASAAGLLVPRPRAAPIVDCHITSTSGIDIMAVKQSVLYLSVGVLPGSRPPPP